ncbi:MAG: hypothetical protein K8I00_02915, partial [Candidatus Omnitrophica bacterium]|nr:hypothetical protein [Candidatus Omnitrophota bacterium]
GSSYPEAQAKLRAIEESLAATAPEIPVGSATCDLLIDRFREYSRQVHHPRTHRRFHDVTEHCLPFLKSRLTAPHLICRITPRLMEDYKRALTDECEGKPALVNFTLYLLKDVFYYAVTLGWLNDNPLLHVRYMDEPGTRAPAVYSEGEMYKLREELTMGQDRVLSVMLYAGLTFSEVKTLYWDAVNLSERYLDVRCGGDGESPVRRIPLDIRLYEFFKDQSEAGPREGPVLEKPELAAGINPCRLRNTFIRDVLSRGVSLTGLNRLLGIPDVARVFRYRIFLPAF